MPRRQSPPSLLSQLGTDWFTRAKGIVWMFSACDPAWRRGETGYRLGTGAPYGRLVESAGCCGTVIGVLDPSYVYCMNMNMNEYTNANTAPISTQWKDKYRESSQVGRLFPLPWPRSLFDHPRTRHLELEAISTKIRTFYLHRSPAWELTWTKVTRRRQGRPSAAGRFFQPFLSDQPR